MRRRMGCRPTFQRPYRMSGPGCGLSMRHRSATAGVPIARQMLCNAAPGHNLEHEPRASDGDRPEAMGGVIAGLLEGRPHDLWHGEQAHAGRGANIRPLVCNRLMAEHHSDVFCQRCQMATRVSLVLPTRLSALRQWQAPRQPSAFAHVARPLRR